MTQTPLNIFDLLMAGPQPSSTNVGGALAGNGDDVGLFDEIINRYLGQTRGVQVGQDGVFGALAGNFAQMPTIIAGVETAVKQDAGKMPEDMLSLLPRQAGPYSDNIHDLLTGYPDQLESGKYEILSSRMENGRLNLEIRGQQPGSQTIRLNLPVESLSALGDSSANRVALNADSYQMARLENLIAKLNLTEMEVQTADPAQAGTADEPIDLKLTADGSAGEIVLRSRLDRNRIRLFANEPEAASRQRSESSDGRNSVGRAVETKTAGAWNENLSETLFGQGKVLSGNARADTHIGVRTPFAEADLFDAWKWQGGQGQGQGSETVEWTESMFGLGKGSLQAETGGKKIDPATVRFCLPDNVQTALRPNGRAITIRIEPRDLGPARLSLAVTNDRLKARIAVESPAAKTVLENSLDRLVEQLSKANIQIDSIEISVDGDSAHNQFFGQQPHWRHRVVSRRVSSDGILTENDVFGNAPPPATPAQWVGAGGVNLLA